MKNRKWLLASSIIVAGATTSFSLISLVGCQDKKIEFEVYAKEQDFSGSNEMFEIPLTFSYTPKNAVAISLINESEEGLDGIDLVHDSIKIKNKQATIQLQIDPSLWVSKDFKFGIKFNYSYTETPFEFSGFNVCYEFEEPQNKDKIKLISNKTISTTETSCKYKILFDKRPIENTITTQALNVKTSRVVSVGFTETAEIVEELGKHYLYFEIGFNSDPVDDLVIAFNMNVKFTNSFGFPQDETFYNCSMIYKNK
ncbi:MAG: hypothetical protein ACOQNY_01040 [Mycoplasmoidaceae bacterium]